MKLIEYQAHFVAYIALQLEELFGGAICDNVKIITTNDIAKWLCVTPQYARRIMDVADKQRVVDIELVNYRGNIKAKKARVTEAYRNQVQRTATKDIANQYMVNLVRANIAHRVNQNKLLKGI